MNEGEDVEIHVHHCPGGDTGEHNKCHKGKYRIKIPSGKVKGSDTIFAYQTSEGCSDSKVVPMCVPEKDDHLCELAVFVGVSESALPGCSGAPALHQACIDTFGKNHRMCTTNDFFYSGAVTVTAQAWILPSRIIGVGGDVMDAFSGETASVPESLNCAGWTTSSCSGLNVQPGGDIGKEYCATALPVACCRCPQ